MVEITKDLDGKTAKKCQGTCFDKDASFLVLNKFQLTKQTFETTDFNNNFDTKRHSRNCTLKKIGTLPNLYLGEEPLRRLRMYETQKGFGKSLRNTF